MAGEPWDMDGKSVDLSEDTLTKAMAEIIAQAPDTRITPTELLITDAGIDYVSERMETDAEFRAAIKERAVRDADYRDFLQAAGIMP